jgi:cysteinyl-tRNA synthetase
VVRETLRADLRADERRWLILDADYVLGLDLERAAAADTSLPLEVSALLDARALARGGKDFATSDDLRSRIAELGFEVTDGPAGQTVRRRD